MADLGKAYVEIVPSASGISGKIKKAIGNDVDVAGESAGKRFSGKFGAMLGGVGKAVGIAVGAAAAGIGALAVGSMKAYGEYEQLVGGAKLMWGDAYDYIADKAANAFSSVQMSTSDYLSQANYYATGLKTALGGDEIAAAKLADGIITAQADIVSATGMSADAVANAFQGVMRGNYTMLDNLGLGIAGTKEGMQQVIDTVNAANGTKYDISNLADAQQALIDFVEMQGMAGYAAAEGSETIQGSISSLKATWSNFVTGLADPNADIGLLISNMMESATAVLGNITPVITQFGKSLIQALPQVVQMLTTQLPEFVNTMFPVLLDSAVQLVTLLVGELPSLVTSVLDMLVANIDKVVEAGIQLGMGLIMAIPDIIVAIVEHIPDIIEGIFVGLINGLTPIVQAGAKIASSIWDGISSWASNLWENAKGLITGIKDAIEQKIEDIKTAGKNIIQGLVDGIVNAKDAVVNKIKEICSNALNAVKEFFGIASPSKVMREQGHWIGMGLVRGIEGTMGAIDSAMELARDHAVAGLNGINATMNLTADTTQTVNLGTIQKLLEIIADKDDQVVINLDNRQLGRSLRSMGVAFA